MESTITTVPTARTIDLRWRVLRANQPRDACAYPGDDAPETFHLAALVDDEVVSVASFYAEPHPEVVGLAPYRLRGMATAPELRGRGLGTELVRRGLMALTSRGADVLWCNARIGAVPFYERLGFARQGEVFELPMIGPHYVMSVRLPPEG